MRKIIGIAVVSFVLVAPIVQAGALYKCSDAKGAITIQSDPCPAGATQIWKRDSAPAAQLSLQQVVANSVSQQNSSGVTRAPPPIVGIVPQSPPSASAPATAVPVTPTPPPSPMPPIAPVAPMVAAEPPTIRLSPVPSPAQPQANSACDAAKQFAASVNDKVWLGLTQDQVQRLYGWVMDQCDNPADDAGTSH